MTPDEFAPLEMNKDEAERAHAAIRRLTKECIDHRHSHSSAKAISSRRRSSALNSVRFTLTPTTPKCGSCMWGCRMSVEMLIDPWK